MLEFTEADFAPEPLTFSEADFTPEASPTGESIGPASTGLTGVLSRAKGEAVRSLVSDTQAGVDPRTSIPRAALAALGLGPEPPGRKPLGNRMERQGTVHALMSGSEDSPIKAGIHRLKVENPGIAGSIWNPIVETGAELASAPGTVLMGGVGALGSAAGRAVSGAFTADMARGTLDAKAQLEAVLADPLSTKAQKAEAATQLALATGMTGMAASHALPGAQGRPPVIPEERAPVPTEEAPRVPAPEPVRFTEEDFTNPPTEPYFAPDVEQVPVPTPDPVRIDSLVSRLEAARMREEPVVAQEPVASVAAPPPEPVNPMVARLEEARIPEEDWTPVEPPRAVEDTVPVAPEPVAVEPETAPPEPVRRPPVIPSESGPTAINDATIDAERAARGEPPAELAATRGWEEVNAQAEAALQRDPAIADRLTAEINDSPRPVTDVEHAILVRRKVALKQAFENATPEQRDAISDELLALEDATSHGGAGTETARALNIRKLALEDDFSIASLETQKREDVGGRRLTADERAELERLSKEHAALVEKTAKLEQERAEAAVAETIHPAILSAAERIVTALEKAGDQALARLRGKLRNVASGVDPTIIVDAAIYGAGKLARKGLDFSRWSAEMLSDIGEAIAPHLQDIWDRSNAIINDAGKREKPAVREILSSSEDVIQAAKQEVQVAERDEIGNRIQRLFKSLVAREVKAGRKADRETLVSEVNDLLPNMSRLEVMDAISGRGKFTLPSQEEVARTVRDLKEQIRLVGHQMDVVSGNPLPRTGPQRGKPSDASRQEQQRLNELKRRYGVTTTNPEAQLASTLQARKTYYTNRMADLRHEIATRERIVKTKSPSPTDSELDSMRREYDQVREEHDAVFGPRELTTEQRIEIATKAAERSAENWDRRLAEAQRGNFDTGAKRPTTVSSPALDAMRARRDAAKDAFEELKSIATRKSPEEIALAQLKSRLNAKMAKMQDQMARGDYSTKPRRQIQEDQEALDLRYKTAQVERKWAKMRLDDQIRRMGRTERIFYEARRGVNTARDIITSFDDSAIGRQGWLLTLANPLRARNAFLRHIEAARSERNQFAIEEGLRKRPNYRLYEKAGLHLSNLADNPTQMEESIRSSLSRKIPILGKAIGVSQRAFTTYLNVLRSDTFDALTESLTKDGKPTPEEAHAIANYINIATGRGGTPAKWKTANEALADIFFAPRYVASRFQILSGYPLWQKDAGRARAVISKEYARFAVGLGVIYGLSKLAGASVEADPRSSDAEKIRIGNTRIDPTAGLATTLTFITRILTGQTKTAKGDIESLRGTDVRFGKRTTGDVISSFLRSKLAPAPQTVANLVTGRDAIGKPISPLKSLQEGLIPAPLLYKDAKAAIEQEGVPAGVAESLMSFFGLGVNTYEDRKKK